MIKLLVILPHYCFWFFRKIAISNSFKNLQDNFIDGERFFSEVFKSRNCSFTEICISMGVCYGTLRVISGQLFCGKPLAFDQMLFR